jgi:hypothetical protein
MKLLYRTRDYAFIISAKGHLLVTFFAGGRVQKMRHTLLAPGKFRGPADAGYQDSCRMLRRVTQTPFIAGPLATIPHTDLTFS